MNQSNKAVHRGPLHDEALQAMRDMIPGVIEEHRRHGQTLVIWRDGKIVEITPDEAEAEYNAAKAKHEAELRAKTGNADVPASLPTAQEQPR